MCQTLPTGRSFTPSRASVQGDLLIYIENTCSVDLGIYNSLTKVKLIEAISKTTKKQNKKYNETE